MPLMTSILVSKMPTGETFLASRDHRQLDWERLTVEGVRFRDRGGVRDAVHAILEKVLSVERSVVVFVRLYSQV